MEDQQLAVQQQQLSVPAMLDSLIKSGITGENVEAMGKLMDLHERLLDRSAKEEFTRSFVKLQSKIPSIAPIKAVPNKDKTIRYRYAPFEEIIKTVQPFLEEFGFVVKFNTRVADCRVVSVCKLMHIGGHSEENEYAVRIGSGPPSSSESQADGAAYTYAKRGALCNALNIVVSGEDDDARNLGKEITPQQAANFRDRVKAVGADEKAFLKFAGVGEDGKYEDIMDAKYDAIDAMLAAKERVKARPIPKKDGPDEPDLGWDADK